MSDAMATSDAPLAVQEAELLYESTPLMARMFGWLWPTSERAAFEAEGRLLSRVTAPITRKLVKIGDNTFINTAIVGHQLSEPTPPTRTIVLCHGYASGLGMWFENLDALAAIPGTRIYAIDWLGKGRSSRPPFKFSPKDPDSCEQSEDFFLSSFESWRAASGIENFVLVGHSLGGYLSAVYALRNPSRVDKLILVSPAGIPTKPDGWDDRFSGPKAPFLYKLVRTLWQSNWTPQMLLRGAGHLGPRLMRTYSDRRFTTLDPEKVALLREYYYHINARAGSGEYALNTILTVGAFARKPLLYRLSGLKPPTAFLYGQYDWMDPEAGRAAAATMSRTATVTTVSMAGHHLYMENVPEFNRELVRLVLDEQ